MAKYVVKWYAPYSKKNLMQIFDNKKDAEFYKRLLTDKGRKASLKTLK